MKKTLPFLNILSLVGFLFFLLQVSALLAQDTSSKILFKNQVSDLSDSAPQMMMNHTVGGGGAALLRALGLLARREEAVATPQTLVTEVLSSEVRGLVAAPLRVGAIAYLPQRNLEVPIVPAQIAQERTGSEEVVETLVIAQPVDRYTVSTNRTMNIVTSFAQSEEDLGLDELDEPVARLLTEIRDTKINCNLAGMKRKQEYSGGEVGPSDTIADYRNKIIEAQFLGNHQLADYWSEAVQAYEKGADYWIDSDQAYSEGNEDKSDFLGFGKNFSGGATSSMMSAAALLVKRAEMYIRIEGARAAGREELVNRWLKIIQAYEKVSNYWIQAALAYAAENQNEGDLFGETALQAVRQRMSNE